MCVFFLLVSTRTTGTTRVSYSVYDRTVEKDTDTQKWIMKRPYDRVSFRCVPHVRLTRPPFGGGGGGGGGEVDEKGDGNVPILQHGVDLLLSTFWNMDMPPPSSSSFSASNTSDSPPLSFRLVDQLSFRTKNNHFRIILSRTRNGQTEKEAERGDTLFTVSVCVFVGTS